MKARKTERGFVVVENEPFNDRLIQESSAVGEYYDSFDNPGSSFLWVGIHHLSREDIKELIDRLQYWLDNKQLELR